MSEGSPVPPALSANDLWIKRVDRYPAECDKDSAPDSISDSENWLDWNGNLDNLNDSEDIWEADTQSDIELLNGVKDSETTEQWDVSAAPHVPGLIRPPRRSKIQAEQVLMVVNTIETERNNGIKKKLDRMSQCIVTRFFM